VKVRALDIVAIRRWTPTRIPEHDPRRTQRLADIHHVEAIFEDVSIRPQRPSDVREAPRVALDRNEDLT
jgi:hypothetical protein